MVLFCSLKLGIKSTLPQILGASLGSALMLFLVGIGFHQVLIKYSIILLIIKYLGVIYILSLAWKIFFENSSINPNAEYKPMSLVNSILFQWINPKAWIMSGVAITTCLPTVFNFQDVLFYSILFIFISFPCVWVWGGFGKFLIQYMNNPNFIKTFNTSCSLLLIISACLMVL